MPRHCLPLLRFGHVDNVSICICGFDHRWICPSPPLSSHGRGGIRRSVKELSLALHTQMPPDNWIESTMSLVRWAGWLMSSPVRESCEQKLLVQHKQHDFDRFARCRLSPNPLMDGAPARTRESACLCVYVWPHAIGIRVANQLHRIAHSPAACTVFLFSFFFNVMSWRRRVKIKPKNINHSFLCRPEMPLRDTKPLRQ